MDEPHRAHAGHLAPGRADAGPAPQQVIGQAGKGELHRLAACFHGAGQWSRRIPALALLPHHGVQTILFFLGPDTVLALFRRGKGERSHRVKQAHQMLHLVAGGQAGNINLHVFLSLSLKVRIPATQGAADIEIVRQFLAKGGKIPVAGQQLGLFGNGQARQLAQAGIHFLHTAALQICAADAALEHSIAHKETTPPSVWPGVCQTVKVSSSTVSFSPS